MAESTIASDAAGGEASRPGAAPRASSLGFRLALAFLAVAFTALGLLLALTLVLIRSDVAQSSKSQAAAIERGFVHAVAAAYDTRTGWSTPQLRPLVALANAYEAQFVLRGPDGTILVSAPLEANGRPLGEATSLPVVVGGTRVATLTMRLARNGAVTSDLALERSLVPAVAITGGVAALVAVVASALVARHVVGPVNALTAAARSLSGGAWNVRVGHRNGPREVDELAAAFNSLATNLQREDALRRALAADIAHELRTPLAVLQVSIEALLDGVLPANAGSFQSLRDEALHVSGVVEDLERIAEAQAAVLHLELRAFRLDLLAGDVLSEIAPVAEAGGRELQRDLLPVVVIADERRIRQVIANLLTNALKFSDPGDSILVRVAPSTPDDAEIIVADTGRGIAPGDLPHIFERFWRSPDSAGTPGRGIGLAIVKELVDAHQGRVRAESQPGRGSRIIVVLPRRQGNA